MRVSAADLRGIVGFLDTAVTRGPADPLPSSMLSALAGLIAADQADYFEVRPDGSVRVFTTGFEEEHPAWLWEASVRLSHLNPLQPFAWRPADGPLRMSEIVGDRRLLRLEYYNDFLRPAHILDRLRVWLWRSAETAACVTLIRSDARFSDRDKAVMAVLQPYFTAMRERSIGADDRSYEAELTIREAQVVALVARGRSNAEIAGLLFLSSATVAKHLEHAYRKLHVAGRSEAAAALRTSSLS
ncbi:MAG TPA: helix-turn-helix transcriptional regulator [Candidatus Limnocylindria bacterium]|nr:helix-turn-helix transcriptional regulator [Candidatus Limnocylindria bacterium]